MMTMTHASGRNGLGRIAQRSIAKAAAIAGLCLALSTGGITVSPAFAAAQQPKPPAAQDEFVPINELPPQEKLPAAQFLIVAYSIVWLGLTGYVWSMWRRLGKVEQELAQVANPATGRRR
jgi:CcmD family protein